MVSPTDCSYVWSRSYVLGALNMKPLATGIRRPEQRTRVWGGRRT
ncbi:hypothetical protein BN1012_Phect3157 [Candidatus Phaeomarinobacter ectocarpi]|uniref:Uncharacterized protein n=1 Tax=Candidatus Phaeomarinibacter ectocarpi TaxID=1458461 RepID=X5MHS3_9HYPH|nr:hypothetical protein BN1012_Phect3157 [Candidatus Phaeomarinobacter ectocarpi]